VKDYSIRQDNNKKKENENVIAWRLSPRLVPMFKDLAEQAYEAHLIKTPKLLNLAKFSLYFFAEMWLQQNIAQSRHQGQQ
jgi:hypothetical protein